MSSTYPVPLIQFVLLRRRGAVTATKKDKK